MSSEENSWKFLCSLWNEDELRGTTCCQCHETLDIGKAFARTFKLDQSSDMKTDLLCARETEVPQVGRTLRIFHRHLECLYNTTAFVAISHVWERPMANFQYMLEESNIPPSQVEDLVRLIPAKIAIAIEEILFPGEALEIWHDYISVPQWALDTKIDIIRNIPELFRRSKTTVVYLADVDSSAFDAMRFGASKEERRRAIGVICSAAWFSRTWTTWEGIESVNMRVVSEQFRLIAPDTFNCVLIDELRGRWQDEVRTYGSGRDLEIIVWEDFNLVPWQLGTINAVRSDILAGRSPCDGHLDAVLSCRRLTRSADFCLVLERMLKTGLKFDGAVYTDPREAIHRIAMRRVLDGDLSPILMVPAHAETGYYPLSGYVDHKTWGLGAEEQPHTCPLVKKGSDSYRVVLSAEEVGVFRHARRFDWPDRGPAYSLGALSRMALDASGVDVDAYVDSIGVRLYGQDRDAIHRRLAEDNRRIRLQEQLHRLYNNFVGITDALITDEIAELIGLSNASLGEAHEEPVKPIVFLEHHGGDLHHGNGGAIVGIMCTRCRGIFLFRIALFKPASSLIGVKAYRFPGLKYRYSHAGGAGILLQDGKRMGRFVWGTPTCDCPKMAEIEVSIDELPMPSANNGRYT